MQKKPLIHVDAVLLIDVWAAETWANLNKETGGSKYTDDEWVKYQKRYIKNSHKFLQNINLLYNKN